jgi:hypothetical protein
MAEAHVVTALSNLSISGTYLPFPQLPLERCLTPYS